MVLTKSRVLGVAGRNSPENKDHPVKNVGGYNSIVTFQ